MTNLKEEVDIYKMYAADSTISKEEFLQRHNINEKRDFE